MGQYYRVFTKQGRKETVYNRYLLVGGKQEYMMAKLMEHSWWGNEFVSSVCTKLYREKQVIAWIGDYASALLEKGYTIPNTIERKQYRRICNKTWNYDKDVGVAIDKADFRLLNRYLVNHTKKQYINLSQYFDENITDEGWCAHPLPILTCVGNGLGGGDFTYTSADTDVDMVGSWAFCEVSIEDVPPTEYDRVQPIFKEQY